MTLADLKIGQDAVLRAIGGQGELRHHLLDMGLTLAPRSPCARSRRWATPSRSSCAAMS